MQFDQLLPILMQSGGNAKLVVESELAPPIAVPLSSLLSSEPGAAAALAKLARPRVSIRNDTSDALIAAPFGNPRPGLWLAKTGAVVAGLILIGYVVGRASR